MTLICDPPQTAALLIKMQRTRLKPPHAQANTMWRPGRGWKAGRGFSEGPIGLGCPLSFYLSPISPAHVISLLSWILFGFFPPGAEALWVLPSGGRTEMQELNIEERIGAASWGQSLPVVTDSQSHSCPAALQPWQKRCGPLCPGWKNGSVLCGKIGSINQIKKKCRGAKNIQCLVLRWCKRFK